MHLDSEHKKAQKKKTMIRKCHVCGHIVESEHEIDKCEKCQKSFLPLNYFGKVHSKNTKDYQNLFADCSELSDDDLIKGLTVIW